MFRNQFTIYFWLGIFLLLNFITLTTLPLGLDEAYYWYWSQHLDLSYFDHPPLIAWIIAAGTNFGHHEFFVRSGGFLLTLIGWYFGFATARRLFPNASPQFAWEYLLLLNLTPIFAGAAIIQTPDTPLFVCWLGALYFGAEIVVAQTAWAWYAAGVCLGFGLLSKYTSVLLVPGMLLFLLIFPTHRHWLQRRELWLSAVLALLIGSPVLIWNAQHEWISFQFQLNQGFSTNSTSVLDNFVKYIIGQMLAVSPLLWLAFVKYSLFDKCRHCNDLVYWYLILMSWPVILFFAGSSLSGAQTEANWPFPAYFAGLLLVWAKLRQQGSHAKNLVIAKIIVAISLVINLSLRIHLLYPWLPLPPHLDRLREFASWPNLGQQIRAAMDAQPSTKITDWFLMSDRGTVLAEAIFYTNRQLIGFDPQRQERYLFLSNTDLQLIGKNAIIIVRTQSSSIEKQWGKLFKRLIALGPYKHKYRNEIIPKHSAYLYMGQYFIGNR